MSSHPMDNIEVTISLPVALYEQMKKELDSKSLKDALGNPFIMVSFHVFEAVESKRAYIDSLAKPVKSDE